MKLTFIAKYPPICGGESTKLYWLAKNLGKKGHECQIISDGFGKRESIKIFLEDFKYLKPENIKLFYSNPEKNSKGLFRLAKEVIEKEGSDLIVGWYLVPYGNAALEISKNTGKPFIFQNAGSDIKKSSWNLEYKKSLINQINWSQGIMSYPAFVDQFKKFSQNVLKHNPLVDLKGYDDAPDFNMPIECKNKKVILFYGKMVGRKGIFNLLDAYEKMGESEEYVLLCVGSEEQERVRKIVLKKGLKNILFLENLPPWKIPGMLRNSDILFLGEKSFHIPLHFSRKALEAMVCKTSVIISPEMKNK